MYSIATWDKEKLPRKNEILRKFMPSEQYGMVAEPSSKE